MPKKKPKSKLDKISSKLNRMDSKLNKLEKVEERVETEEKVVEKKEVQIQKEEQKVENAIFRLGKFTFKRTHLMVLIKGTAGSFLGVGLGRSLLNMEELANKLPWWNIIGILFFILIISGLLIYKSEKETIKTEGLKIVWKRLITLYFLAILVEFIALLLFMSLPASSAALIKVLVIGSYAAMAGAVSFSLV